MNLAEREQRIQEFLRGLARLAVDDMLEADSNAAGVSTESHCRREANNGADGGRAEVARAAEAPHR